MATLTTPITLLEAARHGSLSDVDTALIETFRPGFQQRPNQPINFFDIFPYTDHPGVMSVEYTRELGLPTVTPRALNETNTRSVASTENVKEALKIYPSELVMDVVMQRMNVGPTVLARHLSMHAKAIISAVHNHIFKGDEQSSPNQITGLQARITGDQLVSNSAGTGAALSIATLRSAIDRVYGDNIVIAMGKGIARRMDAAVGLAGVGAAIREGQTMWGQKATLFDGLPIVPIADMKGADNILQFNEAAAGGGSASTSIYILALGSEGVHGLRNGGLFDNAAPDTPAAEARALTMLPGLAIKRVEAAARVYGITDAAVVA